jgi:hypothetical protein
MELDRALEAEAERLLDRDMQEAELLQLLRPSEWASRPRLRPRRGSVTGSASRSRYACVSAGGRCGATTRVQDEGDVVASDEADGRAAHFLLHIEPRRNGKVSA